MTIFMFANNVNTTLAGPISPSATSLTLSSAANLPSSIPAGQVLVIGLNDVGTRQNFEIIYATSISGATLSGLLRAQEGTTALSWGTGDFAYSAPTAGQMRSFGQISEPNTWSGDNTFTEPVAIAPAVSPGQAVNIDQFPAILSSSNGSQTFPSLEIGTGFILKFGEAATNGSGSMIATFADAFPNNWLTGGGTVVNGSAIVNSVTLRSLNKTGIQLDVLNAAGSPISGVNVSWYALGY
ncbi:hypothetical protein AWB78_01349 [Caballeronia calidae]|uniref:Putative tail fiber protein gp53-like C-terminal domain-containing protein n=1 Tax=Caballeronia calidae TaxID=1777139 RepID=A0A158A7R7_9BURK|nr:hypothetical protein [Caballeronia calidae]SAK53676.1 hypothetical protein AWB78_01349 [Caballeronia calidae]